MNRSTEVDEKYWRERSGDDTNTDWNEQGNWIEGYWKSQNHSHRKELMEVISELPSFESVLEVGSNCGPNLQLIRRSFPEVATAGLDINAAAILEGVRKLEDSLFVVGKADALPFKDKTFDIVLTDAVLIYIPPDKITNVIGELGRVARKALVLVEWHSDRANDLGEFDAHWTRNYKKLFDDVALHKIKSWPDCMWQKYGYIIQASL